MKKIILNFFGYRNQTHKLVKLLQKDDLLQVKYYVTYYKSVLDVSLMKLSWLSSKTVFNKLLKNKRFNAEKTGLWALYHYKLELFVQIGNRR